MYFYSANTSPKANGFPIVHASNLKLRLDSHTVKINQVLFDRMNNYTDHLGNIRVSYTKDPQTDKLKILDENHYYPFGLKHENYLPLEKWKFIQDEIEQSKTRLVRTRVDDYKYKYNGKEWQDELNLNFYDYGWRNYDPAIGRWMNVDPLAEKYYSTSPYNYVLNNPIKFIDPDGMAVWTDYKLLKNGEIERVDPNDGTESDPTDTLYATDSKGNVVKNNSIKVNKGALDNTETEQIYDSVTDPENKIPTRVMNVSTAGNTIGLFEFMANNTDVEHSITFFRNGKTFIGTSFRENVELSINITIPKNGQPLLSVHSHSLHSTPSEDDIEIARSMKIKYPAGTPYLKIYYTQDGTYHLYDENSPPTTILLDDAVLIYDLK